MSVPTSQRSIATSLILWILGVYVFFIGCFMAVLASAVHVGFLKIEDQVLGEDVGRVQNAFNVEVEGLRTLCREYSAWDETYQFMETGDSRYIDYNMPLDWRRRVDLKLIAFIRPDGTILWERRLKDGYFDDPGRDAMIRPRLSDLAVSERDGGTALFTTNRGPLYLSVEPILRSDGSGESRGLLVFGRLLNQRRIVLLEETTRTLVRLRERGEAERLSQDRAAYRTRRGDDYLAHPFQVSLDTGDRITLEVLRNRDLWEAGQRILWFVGIAITAMSAVSALMLIVLLRRFVVRPILLITDFLEGVTVSEDFSRRLHLPRSDEPGALAEHISGLLAHIESRALELKRLNEELEKVANTDRLTGLPNRRMFETHLTREIRRLRRELMGTTRHGQLSVLLCDVDFFKLYNDTYGHPAGDACLTAIGAAIQGCILRPEDLACRYGGEEFLVVLPDCDRKGASCVGERILEAVRSLELPHAASTVSPRVTISVGGASATVTDTFDQESLLTAADEALYRAKRNGRDRYCGAEDHIP